MIKRIPLLILFSFIIQLNSFTQCLEHIFFSEYLEGSSNNKVIELYNPTLNAIDLSDYVIYRYNNGNPSPDDSLLPLGILESDSVFLIVNPSADPILLAKQDTVHTITFFNGDDAMELVHKLTGDTIDVIGEVGVDPGTNWPVGIGATSEFTLVRKATIKMGQKDWSIGATEWDVFPQNTFDSIGTHSISYSLGGLINDTLPPISICLGDSALIFGNYYAVSGFYSDTNLSEGGCDSITYQELIVNPTYNDTLTPVMICMGDSALIFGNYYQVSGFYIDSNTSQHGCDSVSITELIINPTYQDTLPIIHLCDGDSVLIFGIYQNSNGIYIDSNSTILGCDSVTIQELIIHTLTIDTLPALNICEGDSIFIFGSYQITSGFYTDSNASQYSCDSISVVELIVNQAYNDTLLPISICQNDSVLIFGNYESTPGFYINSLVTYFGCDSIEIQELIIKNHALSSINDTICDGDSVLIGGNWYAVAGTVLDTLTGASTNGCDSIVTHNIYINFVSPSIDLGTDITVCDDDSVILIASPNYSNYLWSNGNTSNSILIDGTILGLGTFSYSVIVQDSLNGCYDADSVNVTFINCVGVEEFFSNSTLMNIYPNPTEDNINININDNTSKINVITIYDVTGKAILVKPLINNLLQIDISNLPNGIYQVIALGDGISISNKFIKN